MQTSDVQIHKLMATFQQAGGDAGGAAGAEQGDGQPDSGPAEAAAEQGQDANSKDPEGLVLEVNVADYLPGFVKPGWEYLQEFPLLLSLLLVTLGFGLGKFLQYSIQKVLGRLTEKTRSNLDNDIVRYLAAPILQSTVTLALVLAVLVLQLPETFERVLIRILFSLLLLFWGRAWFRATHVILQALEANRERFKVIQPRTKPLFEMGVKLVLLGMFVYLFFTIWGIDATAWLASAGIIGIAVGFAAKDTLANLISGVSILADAPYKIGDYIVLDTGERGIVTNLGIRSTRLLTRDDVEISIPNAVIGAAKVTNESGGPWVKQRIRVPVGVAYGTDTGKVVEILEDIARYNTDIVDNPAPRARMRGFGDSALNFELLGWINLPEQRGLVIHNILLEINRRFIAEGIQIPYPQRDLHIRSDSTGKAAED